MSRYPYFYGNTHQVIGYYDINPINLAAAITVNLPGNNASLAINTGAFILNPQLYSVLSPIKSVNITLGNGANHIVSSGAANTIFLGDGNNTVATAGFRDFVYLGNGNNTVNYYGKGYSVFELGNGHNTVVDHNGSHDSFYVGGNATVIANGSYQQIDAGAGGGNVSISALGVADHIAVDANAQSVDTIKMGSSSTLWISGGRDQITLNGNGDTVLADALVAGSNITAHGNAMLFIGSNSSATIHLDLNARNVITIQALGGDSKYTGTLHVTGFGPDDRMTLNGLGFHKSTGIFTQAQYNPVDDVLSKYDAATHTLSFAGGGRVIFDATSDIRSTEFLVGSAHGRVEL